MRVTGFNNAYEAAYRYASSIKKADSAASFAESLTEAEKTDMLKSASAAETGETEAVSVKDMTMEEYKQYIYDKISEIPLHPTQRLGMISVQISDEGFEAMKNDPEYERWVLNDLRIGFAQSNPWAAVCGGTFSVIRYGATKEDCSAEMWSAGFNNGRGAEKYEEETTEDFWELRIKRQQKLDDIYEDKLLKRKAFEKAVLKEKMQEEMITSGKGVLFLFSAAQDIFLHMSAAAQ